MTQFGSSIMTCVLACLQGAGPVVLVLLDTSAAAGEDFQELLRSSLAAALEALSPGTMMGLIGFSDRISMVDMQGKRGEGLRGVAEASALAAFTESMFQAGAGGGGGWSCGLLELQHMEQ